MLAFALAGCFLLVNRLKVRQLEIEAIRAHGEVESTRRLAEAFLELRDLMNTPIQSIQIAATLLKGQGSQQDEILQQLDQSCERLREVNRMLKKYEHEVDWKAGRGGLGEREST